VAASKDGGSGTVPQAVEVIGGDVLPKVCRWIRINRKPIVIMGAMYRWAALSKWTDDYLEKAIGAEREVFASVSSTCEIHKDRAREVRVESMTFAHFLERISGRKPSGERYYLTQVCIPECFPDLLADLEIPLPIRRRCLSINLWFGGEGSITPLHFDAGDGFICQIKGSKEVVLYSVDEFPASFPNPLGGLGPSRDSPRGVVSSSLREAHPFECVLRAGEMLYIPAGWWHRVRNLEVSMSVNFWWIAPWSFYFSQAGLHVVPLAMKSACSLTRKQILIFLSALRG
jgi:hypothetical protein